MYGIATLGIIPMRAFPAETAEMVSQMLFGESYKVLATSENQKWCYILTDSDQYNGWISTGQHHEIDKITYKNYQKLPFVLSKGFENFAILQQITQQDKQKYKFALPQGCIIKKNEDESLILGDKIFSFEGDFQKNIKKSKKHFLKEIKYLKNFLHAPYLWGGKTPFGVDCSGFVQQIYKFFGVNLLRDARLQHKQGEEVWQLEDLQSGDLAFFERNDKVVHVGIVFSQDDANKFLKKIKIPQNFENAFMIVHCSDFVRIDFLDKKGIFRQDTQLYSHTTPSFRRFF